MCNYQGGIQHDDLNRHISSSAQHKIVLQHFLDVCLWGISTRIHFTLAGLEMVLVIFLNWFRDFSLIRLLLPYHCASCLAVLHVVCDSALASEKLRWKKIISQPKSQIHPPLNVQFFVLFLRTCWSLHLARQSFPELLAAGWHKSVWVAELQTWGQINTWPDRPWVAVL